VRIIALCRLCHSATHYGHSKRTKNMDKIHMHIKKINNYTDEELDNHIKDAYNLWKERNKVKWNLDFSIITNSGFIIKSLYNI
jgi:CDP-diacylglycerol pyrophosphatase